MSPTGLTSLGQLRSARYPDWIFDLGCCLIARRELISIALPIPISIAHDTWFNRLAIALGGRYLLDEPLQLYRRHNMTVSGYMSGVASSLQRTNLVNQININRKCEDRDLSYTKGLAICDAIIARISDRAHWIADNIQLSNGVNEVINRVEREREAFNRRIQLQKMNGLKRKIGAIRLWNKGDYVFFRGWLSFASDFLHRKL